MFVGSNRKFFRSSRQGNVDRIEEAASRIAQETGISSDGRVGEGKPAPTEQDFLDMILEFVATIGFYPEQFTIGEVIDMLQMRMENQQIGWACSAQNPDLLPQRMKNGSKKRDNRR